MNCIIVDDEPLAREGMAVLVSSTPQLTLTGMFGSAAAAQKFMADNPVDLVFLDIQMPGITGLDFARVIPQKTLVIFTTAYAEYALDSYEVEAIDYLIKPVKPEQYRRAVDKATAYHQLLTLQSAGGNAGSIEHEYFFVKADRKIFRILFNDIFFIEGLKDYVVIHTEVKKIITAMNIKTIYEQLPQSVFARISKSYIINTRHINSFDNNSVLIGNNELPIGNAYRDQFFAEFVTKKLFDR